MYLVFYTVQEARELNKLPLHVNTPLNGRNDPSNHIKHCL